MTISLLLLISVVLYVTDLPSCFSADQHYVECRRPLRCGSEPSLFPNITYPFWGKNIGKPSFCGQTEFELSCKENQTLTLEIEHITLRVISVKLDNKTITVADESLFEDGCPHSFNFTGAKQYTLNHNTETIDLFNCADNDSTGSLSTVSCHLSKDVPITYHVFGSSYHPQNCTKFGEIPMLKSAKNELNQLNQTLKMALQKGFELRYDKEGKTCRDCTSTSGICGSESGSGNFACLCADKPHRSSCHDETRVPNYKAKIGIAAGASIFGITAASIAWFVYHRRITKVYRTSSLLLPRNHSNTFSKPSSDVEKAEELLVGVHLFSYEELEEATNSFDPSKELGDGGFGTVYYGKLKDGRSVAVKRLYDNNFKRAEQFRNEVEILTGLRHPNLVTLFGCTSKQSRDLLLVYEYVANGTLADHLRSGTHVKPSPLPWSTRLKIAVETASALNYLHASEIIHRDVKSSNILLDQNFNVKVADFGLSRLFPSGQTHVSTGPQGTPGYVDPDYHLSYQLSNKSDVFSFAVVLMELISSLPAVDMTRPHQEINLSNMAIIKIQSRKLQEMVDPSLGFDTNKEVRQTVIAVAELAFQCLQSDKDLRPCMSHVVETLTRIQNIRFGSEMDVADVSKSGPLVALSVDVTDVSQSAPSVAQSPDSVIVKWISK